MEEGCGCLGIAILIIIAFYIAIYVVLPATVFVVAGVAAVGVAAGTVVASINFVKVFGEAHKVIH